MNRSNPQHLEPSTNQISKNRTQTTVLILLIFLLGNFIPTWIQSTDTYNSMFGSWIYEARALAKPVSRMLIILLCAWFLLGIHPKKLPAALTLTPGWKAVKAGIALGILFSSPLLIVGALGGINDQVVLRSLHFHSLSPGVFEEIFFRAFGFGFLVRLVNCRVWPTAIFTGVLFALAHIHLDRIQNKSIEGQLLELALLALAGTIFAWLYARWNFNLYIVITMHTISNLCFALFNMNNSLLGAAGGAIAISITFTFSCVVTARRAKSMKMEKIRAESN